MIALAGIAGRGPGAEPLLVVEEISHRVTNEFASAIAAVNLEAGRVFDADARAVLRRTIGKLQAFADAHRVLRPPADLDDMCLGDYLDRVCLALSRANLGERGVRLILLEDAIPLAAERCWRVALISAEPIANSIRRGRGELSGLIVVEVLRVQDQTVSTVAEIGGAARHPAMSRGGRVVARLAQGLGGDISWCFGPNSVTASFAFPARDAPAEVPERPTTFV